MNKKSLIIGATLFLVTAQMAFADFPDVPNTNAYYIPIQYFASENIFTSYPDGNFHPEDYFSFAEGIKLIFDESGIAVPASVTGNVFNDVASTDIYANYLLKAKDLGFIQGDGDNNVHPTDNMTRAQFVKILLEVKGFNGINWENQNMFNDVPATAWFNPYMNFAGTNGLISPDESGHLYPSQAMSRGEAAQALYVTELMKNRLNLQFLAAQAQAEINQTQAYINNNDFASAAIASAFADSLGQEIYLLGSTNSAVVGEAKIGRAYHNLVEAYIAKKRNNSAGALNYANTAIEKSNEAISTDTSDSSAADNVINLANQFEN